MTGTQRLSRPHSDPDPSVTTGFRRDIQGLRGLAVAMVVVYHAHPAWLPGGYVGVDVFFVVSGFVISSVLFDHGAVSIRDFYARRARRILPAATLVVVATVLASYHYLGFVRGARVAVDGQWAALFAANLHFAHIGNDYFGAQLAPSPLQHFWSLGVEEQFYLVFPLAILLLCKGIRRNVAILLVAVVVASFVWSIVQTGDDGTWAYYSPLTRAWELAIGAGLALGAHRLVRLTPRTRTVAAVVGLAAIVAAGVGFDDATHYPGYAVAVPVVGTALVLAAGTAGNPQVSRILLGNRVITGLGDISYSLYLWHWPLLVIAAEDLGHPPGAAATVGLVASAVVLSVATYVLVENPVRRSAWLRARPATSLRFGAVLVAATVAVCALLRVVHPTTSGATTPAAGRPPSLATVLATVRDARSITSVPSDLTPPVTDPDDAGAVRCHATPLGPSDYCLSGDVHATRSIVVYGDSHAAEWTYALNEIALRNGYRLYRFTLDGCPAPDLSYYSYETRGTNTPCDAWHATAPARIARLHPRIVVVASTSNDPLNPQRDAITSEQYQRGMTATLESLSAVGTHVVMLGDYSYLPVAASDCVGAHPHDIQACDTTRAAQASTGDRGAERAAASAAHAHYIDTLPWTCSSVCTPVIGRYLVYKDIFHLTAAYTQFLAGALATRLGLQR